MNGAQLERTSLSWRRTIISFTAVSLLLARFTTLHTSRPVALIVLCVIGLSWAAAVRLALSRIHRLECPVRRTLPLIATITLLYCVLGTWLLVS